MTIRFILAAVLTLSLLTARGQTIEIGIIDFYGLNNITEDQARAVLTISEGDSLSQPAEGPPPQALRDSEHVLLQLTGVTGARIEPICCHEGRLMLYVGIEETGRTALEFRAAPSGTIRLSEEVMELGQQFYRAIASAAQQDNTGEDHSQGHALSHDPVMREIQEQFIRIAQQDYKHLRDVMRTSSASDHRSLAALIMGYAADKKRVAVDLANAVNDPDIFVRNNSIRNLWVIAGFANTHPNQGIVIPAQPFIELLNSMEWSDRNKSSLALMNITKSRNENLLADLREQALTPLLEMAGWKNPGHAVPAIMILGRIGGMQEKAIYSAIEQGDISPVFQSLHKN